jgi:two-component system, response regulator YcbB
MSLSFVIVDDDAASRRMLQSIIMESKLGEVSGMAGGGVEGMQTVLACNPDVVLIDLLMPDQDGIVTISQLKDRGFQGKYIMISKIENKEMVGQAYETGIEFFIHKPINRVEVQAVLSKMDAGWKYERYVREIKRSLEKLEVVEKPANRKEPSIRDLAKAILLDMGIIGEAGSKDIMAIMEDLVGRPQQTAFPPLKELYEAAAKADNREGKDVDKEAKAIEQRIRRTVMAAMTNMASIGLTDYCNPKFEYFAPLYFDFQDVRLRMKAIEEESPIDKSKANIKKFLQVFYLELLEKKKQ